MARTEQPVHRSVDPSSRRARTGWISRHGLIGYTLIAYGISWTLLVGGFLSTRGGVLNPEGQLVGLMSQLAAAGPLIAAVVVLAVTRGRAGLADLGRALVRWRVHPLWYAFVFLGMPLLMVAAVTALHPGPMLPALAGGWPLLVTTLPLNVLAIAVVTGLAEEPGWRGYAQPSANRRFTPLVAALVVSVIWAAWHLPNALFGQTVGETAAHFLLTVVNGFVLAWVYNATRGSVLIVMLLHGAQNATNGLVTRLLAGTDTDLSKTEYYLTSAVVFGLLMAVVAIRTRGRLGA
jgi:membrane protease YdiL (CAAX protease family)